jgi:hypothetical protein
LQLMRLHLLVRPLFQPLLHQANIASRPWA